MYKTNGTLSVLTADAKEFISRFTEDWDVYSFKQLSQTKYVQSHLLLTVLPDHLSSRSLPVSPTRLATSARRCLGRIAANDDLEGLYQTMSADLLACTGFFADDLYFT